MMTFKEYLLSEDQTTGSQLELTRGLQMQAMKKKSDFDQKADKDITRYQQTIQKLAVLKSKEDEDKDTADKKEQQAQTVKTSSGKETTQQIAPSPRIGFGSQP